MELKKTPKADLENKKNIFLEIGFVVALAATFLAFEWKVSVSEPTSFITLSDEPADIEMIPITVMNRLPPPPPPSIKPAEFLLIVEDLPNEEEELELTDATDDSNNTEINLEDLGSYSEENNSDEIIPFLPIEDMPVFPGNVQKWISTHVKYPEIARDNGVQGKVFIQFVVERDGSVSNVKVARGVDPSLDKEAVRVISSMPKWKPGKQREKPVRVSYTLPIVFQLGY